MAHDEQRLEQQRNPAIFTEDSKLFISYRNPQDAAFRRVRRNTSTKVSLQMMKELFEQPGSQRW